MADYVKFWAYVTNKSKSKYEVKYELTNSTTMYIDEEDLHEDYASLTPSINRKQKIVGKIEGEIKAVKSIDAIVEDSVADLFISNNEAGIQYAIMKFGQFKDTRGKGGGTGTGGSKQVQDSDLGYFV